MASRRKSASSEAEEKPPSMATSAGAGGEADEDDESEEDLDFLTKLSSELQYGYRILRHLTQDQNVVWPFLEPVDVEGLQLNGYHEIIDRPICFKDIEQKFRDCGYDSLTAFVADVRLVLINCYRFNGAQHSISKMAQRIEHMLEQKIALLPKALREKSTLMATLVYIDPVRHAEAQRTKAAEPSAVLEAAGTRRRQPRTANLDVPPTHSQLLRYLQEHQSSSTSSSAATPVPSVPMKGKQRDTRSLTGLPQATSPSKPQQPAPVKHSPEKKQAATQKAISAPAPGPSEREKKVNVEEKKRKGSTSDKRHGAKKESSVVDKATPNEKKQPPSHRKTSVSDKKQAGEVRCPSSDKKPASSAATTASATSSSSPTSSEKKVLSLSAQGGPKGSEKKSEKLTEWEARELRPQLEVLDSISKLPVMLNWMQCYKDVLSLPNVCLAELEIGLIFPQQSTLMARLMSAILVHPQLRERYLKTRRPMSYRLWNVCIIRLLHCWRTVVEYCGQSKAVHLFRVSEKSLSLANDALTNDFHHLNLSRRCDTLFALCEYALSCQLQFDGASVSQSADPAANAEILGEDKHARLIFHFPQITNGCIRIYRQKQERPCTSSASSSTSSESEQHRKGSAAAPPKAVNLEKPMSLCCRGFDGLKTYLRSTEKSGCLPLLSAIRSFYTNVVSQEARMERDHTKHLQQGLRDVDAFEDDANSLSKKSTAPQPEKLYRIEPMTSRLPPSSSAAGQQKSKPQSPRKSSQPPVISSVFSNIYSGLETSACTSTGFMLEVTSGSDQQQVWDREERAWLFNSPSNATDKSLSSHLPQLTTRPSPVEVDKSLPDMPPLQGQTKPAPSLSPICSVGVVSSSVASSVGSAPPTMSMAVSASSANVVASASQQSRQSNAQSQGPTSRSPDVFNFGAAETPPMPSSTELKKMTPTQTCPAPAPHTTVSTVGSDAAASMRPKGHVPSAEVHPVKRRLSGEEKHQAQGFAAKRSYPPPLMKKEKASSQPGKQPRSDEESESLPKPTAHKTTERHRIVSSSAPPQSAHSESSARSASGKSGGTFLMSNLISPKRKQKRHSPPTEGEPSRHPPQAQHLSSAHQQQQQQPVHTVPIRIGYSTGPQGQPISYACPPGMVPGFPGAAPDHQGHAQGPFPKPSQEYPTQYLQQQLPPGMVIAGEGQPGVPPGHILVQGHPQLAPHPMFLQPQPAPGEVYHVPQEGMSFPGQQVQQQIVMQPVPGAVPPGSHPGFHQYAGSTPSGQILVQVPMGQPMPTSVVPQAHAHRPR